MKPVASMTGFASAARPTALGRLTLELRSVNSRFLDLSLKMPDDLRGTEAAVREAITAHIARGKVECRISVARGAGENEPQLNPAALQQLAALASQVSQNLPTADRSAPQTSSIGRASWRHPAPSLTSCALKFWRRWLKLEPPWPNKTPQGAALVTVMLAQCKQIDQVAAQVERARAGPARVG